MQRQRRSRSMWIRHSPPSCVLVTHYSRHAQRAEDWLFRLCEMVSWSPLRAPHRLFLLVSWFTCGSRLMSSKKLKSCFENTIQNSDSDIYQSKFVWASTLTSCTEDGSGFICTRSMLNTGSTEASQGRTSACPLRSWGSVRTSLRSLQRSFWIFTMPWKKCGGHRKTEAVGHSTQPTAPAKSMAPRLRIRVQGRKSRPPPPFDGRSSERDPTVPSWMLGLPFPVSPLGRPQIHGIPEVLHKVGRIRSADLSGVLHKALRRLE